MIIRAILLLAAATKVIATVASSAPWKPYTHSIGASIGYASHVFLDQQASPLRYRGAAPSYGLQYAYSTRNGLYRIGGTYVGGVLKPAISVPDGMFEACHRLRFQGGYVHALFTFPEGRGRVFAGFYLDNLYTRRIHYFFNSTADLFVEFSSALHPTLELYYSPSENHLLRLRIGISAVAVVVNNPYSVRGVLDHGLHLFDSFTQGGFLLSYQYLFSSRLRGEVKYVFDHIRHAIPQRFRCSNDQLSIGITYAIQ